MLRQVKLKELYKVFILIFFILLLNEKARCQKEFITYYGGKKMYFGAEVMSFNESDWKDNRTLIEFDLIKKKVSFLAGELGSFSYTDVYFELLPEPTIKKNEHGSFSFYEIECKTLEGNEILLYVQLPKSDVPAQKGYISFVDEGLILTFAGQTY
jgi:hypothetical protein